MSHSPDPGSDPGSKPDDVTVTGSSDSAPTDSVPPRRPADKEARNPRLERMGERTEDFVETVESAIGKAVPPHIRLRERARHNTATNILWRAGVLALGIGLILAGMVMWVLPGPGWGAVILGLVVLATEYTWANRLLQPVRRRARAAARTAADPKHRRTVVIASVVGAIAFAAAAWWYVGRFGFGPPW